MTELSKINTVSYLGYSVEYTEYYYLDYEVDENTGKRNKSIQVPYHTNEQIDRNVKAMLEAYNIAENNNGLIL